MNKYKKKIPLTEALEIMDSMLQVRCKDTRQKSADAIETILAEYHSFKSAYEQVRWERDVAIEQLAEIGKSLGEKMDDIKVQLEDKENG